MAIIIAGNSTSFSYFHKTFNESLYTVSMGLINWGSKDNVGKMHIFREMQDIVKIYIFFFPFFYSLIYIFVKSSMPPEVIKQHRHSGVLHTSISCFGHFEEVYLMKTRKGKEVGSRERNTSDFPQQAEWLFLKRQRIFSANYFQLMHHLL